MIIIHMIILLSVLCVVQQQNHPSVLTNNHQPSRQPSSPAFFLPSQCSSCRYVVGEYFILPDNWLMVQYTVFQSLTASEDVFSSDDESSVSRSVYGYMCVWLNVELVMAWDWLQHFWGSSSCKNTENRGRCPFLSPDKWQKTTSLPNPFPFPQNYTPRVKCALRSKMMPPEIMKKFVAGIARAVYVLSVTQLQVNMRALESRSFNATHSWSHQLDVRM